MVTDLRLSGAQTGHRNESDIRVNYNNLRELVGSCNSTTASNEQFCSSDAGSPWSQSSLPTVSGDISQGDPAVDWTSDGTSWALVVGIGTTGNVVRAFKPSDGGSTFAPWSNFLMAVDTTATLTEMETQLTSQAWYKDAPDSLQLHGALKAFWSTWRSPASEGRPGDGGEEEDAVGKAIADSVETLRQYGGFAKRYSFGP